MEQTRKKQLILSVIGVIVLILIVGGISYAMYTFIGTGSKENVITSGKISIDYKEKTTINLNGAYPMTDQRGIAEENNGTVEFDVISDIVGNQDINYAIGLTDITTGATLKEDNIKIYMYKNGTRVSGFEEGIGKTISEFEPYYITGIMDKYVLTTDTISGKTTNTYKIKAWVDENYKLPTTYAGTCSNTEYTTPDTCRANGETWTDTTTGEHGNTTTSETFTFKVKVVATDQVLAINADNENPVITDIKMYLVEEVAMLNENNKNIMLLANTNREELTNQILTKDNKIEIEVIYSENVYGTSPTLELKFGNNTSVGQVSTGTISENKITYNYTVQEQDNGKIQVGSITSGGIKDNNGNQALSTVASTIQDKIGSVIADNVAPIINTFYIGGETNPAYINKLDTTAYITYNDTDVASYCITTENTSNNCNWITATASPINANYTLTNTEGTKTVYTYIKDKAGNISVSKQDSIVLDKTLPVISSFTHLGSGIIKVVTTDTNLDSVCVNTSAIDVTGCSWTTTTGTYQTTVTTATNYYAHVKDKAGNIAHSSALSVILNLDTSGANVPDLPSNMIPVYYDATNDVWRKADKNNSNSSYQWFSYESSGSKKGMWANAVTVTATNRTTYLNAALGTAIPMSDINTMWVWIPRFNAVTPSGYNGGTQEAPGAINVTFVNNSTTALDAFTFDGQKSGFWFAKFEMSHSTLASSTTFNNLGCTTEICSNANGIIIKPNVTSLRYNSVSNFFYASRSMEQTNNPYGFVTSEVDTHMIKNNEWGAVVYLTQSIYGRCTSSTSCIEVERNWQTYYTGGGATNTYKTNLEQTTTGNIYGIYDMRGSADEYVMGNYNNTIGYSGFSSMPDNKYVNIYTGTNYIGHALSETYGWYTNRGNFVNSNNCWFQRDHYTTSISMGDTHPGGIFGFVSLGGSGYSNLGTRISIVK